MSMTLDAAAAAMREAMRETVKRHSLWYLIQAALMVIVGVLALIYPLVSSVAVVLFLGWMLIISGIVQGISLFDARNVPHFWLQLVSVVLSLIVGVLFLRDPSQALLAVTLLLIVFLMVEGISKVIFALTIRPFPNWGWVLASGIIGILLALYLGPASRSRQSGCLASCSVSSLSAKGPLSVTWLGRFATVDAAAVVLFMILLCQMTRQVLGFRDSAQQAEAI
jgi:uncharacterized membrane protein HdeD (DUF308 family)